MEIETVIPKDPLYKRDGVGVEAGLFRLIVVALKKIGEEEDGDTIPTTFEFDAEGVGATLVMIGVRLAAELADEGARVMIEAEADAEGNKTEREDELETGAGEKTGTLEELDNETTELEPSERAGAGEAVTTITENTVTVTVATPESEELERTGVGETETTGLDEMLGVGVALDTSLVGNVGNICRFRSSVARKAARECSELSRLLR